MKKYNVNYIESDKLNITGKGENPLWLDAEILDNFISAWDKEELAKIEFKALWDSEKLYFIFKVFDSEVHIDQKDNSIESIGNSDRVELFFRMDTSLNPYYCLEIDPTPRIMDFIAYPNKSFNYSWSWPKNDINVKSYIEKDFFTVEGSISLNSLRKLNLIKENKIEVGIFRAKYRKQKNSNFKPIWISWINPKTATPNFHLASSFGILNLIVQKEK